MMKCIEAAVASGHITREEGQALQRDIDQRLRQGLASPVVKQRMIEDLEAAAQEKRRVTLLTEARRAELEQAILSHKNARGENDPAQAIIYLLEHHGQARFADVEHLRISILSGIHSEIEEFLHQFRKGAVVGDKRRQADSRFHDAEVVAKLDNVARELFGENSKSQPAKEMAGALGHVIEMLRQRANAAGMHIRKLDNYVPQHHDPEALLRAGQKGWVDYMMQKGVLARHKMLNLAGKPMSDDDLRQALNVAWERITSDGWIDREPSTIPYGKGPLYNRHDDTRFLHFKDATAWLDYQRNFSGGDPYTAVLGYIGKMARDIAFMEVMGPNPDAMKTWLHQLVMKQAATAKPAATVIAEQTAWLKEMIEKATGGSKYDETVKEIGGIVSRLAELRRRLDANGTGRDAQLEARMWNEIDRLDKIYANVGQMDAGSMVTRTAAIRERRAVIQRELELLGGKTAPQLQGLSRRNRRKRDELLAEQGRLEIEQQKLESGGGTLREVQSGDVDRIGRMIEAMRGDLAQRTGKEDAAADGFFERPQAFRSVDDPQSAARQAIKRFDAMWDVMRGNAEAPVNARVANAFQAGRNIMSAALLGQASITALADVAFGRAARKFAGLEGGAVAVMGGMITHFAQGSRREAVRAGLILDSALHVMQTQARYIEGVDTRSLTGYLADRVISYSGLSAWTQAGKHAFGMAFQAELADRVKLAFQELPELLQSTFRRHGITSQMWDQIRTAKLYNPTDGLELLRPNEIAKLGAGGRELAEAYLTMIHRETKFAVPEGTVRTSSYFKSAPPGTLAGELGRNFGQFKSFGASVVLNWGGRMMAEHQAGATGRALQMTTGLLFTGALAGALVIELKDVVNGKDPRGMRQWQNGQAPGADYWMQALLQAGGLGIVGDFMFSGVNRFSGGLSSFVVGPVGGQLDRMRDRTFGNVDEFAKGENLKLGREAVATVRDLMPGGTLWYLRLAKERYVMNNLEWWVDPKAARKSWETLERNTAKKQKTEYWWRPGQMERSRAPLGIGG